MHYGDNKPAKELSYYSRQLIAREIELEKVRRAEAYFSEKVSNMMEGYWLNQKQLPSCGVWVCLSFYIYGVRTVLW